MFDTQEIFNENIKISEYLAKLGISVFNERGEFRSLEDIIKECSNIESNILN